MNPAFLTKEDIAIGMQFVAGGKQKRTYTVADIWKTYNTAGELVKTRYPSTFELCGQKITDYEIVAVSIQKGFKAE